MTSGNKLDAPEAQDGAIEHEDDIDWHEIIDTTESDYRRRRFAFNSADCATEEEVTSSLHAWIHSVFEEEIEDVEQVNSVHAQS
jgi:hypothetical protein